MCPVSEFKRHSDIVAEKNLSFAERFGHQRIFEKAAFKYLRIYITHRSDFFKTVLYWPYNSFLKFLYFYTQYILRSRTWFFRWNWISFNPRYIPFSKMVLTIFVELMYDIDRYQNRGLTLFNFQGKLFILN